jgi:hypothetical protein
VRRLRRGAAMEFDDTTIRKLFGTDTAEDEDSERLKAYFFRNKSYQNIRAGLPLRILVGHKGIGKSALLRMSHLEDRDEGVLSLWIQPNDLIIHTRSNSFVERIDAYKKIITQAIYKKSVERLCLKGPAPLVSLQETGKQLIKALYDKVLSQAGADVDEETDRLRRMFSVGRIVRYT